MKDDLKRFDKDGLRFGQRLHVPYEKGVDPDDVYSSVAYDVSPLIHLSCLCSATS